MKTGKSRNKSRKIRLPRNGAGYTELSNFFDRHDGADLLDRGIMEIDPDRDDLEHMRLERMRLERIRIPPSTA